MNEINGLPAHVILVHAIVVLVPLTAVGVLLCAFWPAARRRLVWPTLILAFGSLGLTPLTTDAGEWLQRRVPQTPLIRAHTQLGDTLLPWTIGLFLVSAAIAFLYVREVRAGRQSDAGSTAGDAVVGSDADDSGTVGVSGATATAVAPVTAKAGWERVAAVAVPVLAVVVAVGSVVAVYRIGDSGAQAVWNGKFSQTTVSSPNSGPADGG